MAIEEINKGILNSRLADLFTNIPLQFRPEIWHEVQYWINSAYEEGKNEQLNRYLKAKETVVEQYKRGFIKGREAENKRCAEIARKLGGEMTCCDEYVPCTIPEAIAKKLGKMMDEAYWKKADTDLDKIKGESQSKICEHTWVREKCVDCSPSNKEVRLGCKDCNKEFKSGTHILDVQEHIKSHNKPSIWEDKSWRYELKCLLDRVQLGDIGCYAHVESFFKTKMIDILEGLKTECLNHKAIDSAIKELGGKV